MNDFFSYPEIKEHISHPHTLQKTLINTIFKEKTDIFSYLLRNYHSMLEIADLEPYRKRMNKEQKEIWKKFKLEKTLQNSLSIKDSPIRKNKI